MKEWILAAHKGMERRTIYVEQRMISNTSLYSNSVYSAPAVAVITLPRMYTQQVYVYTCVRTCVYILNSKLFARGAGSCR